MNITSQHLDVVPFELANKGEGGEELTKRGENFGHPVGVGALPLIPLFFMDLSLPCWYQTSLGPSQY